MWRPGSAGRPTWWPGWRPAPSSTTVYALVGTSLASQESVPAAFAVLAASPDDPWLACRMAASLGGDCDTIAAMAGAIGGACHGLGGFPAARAAHRRQVNDLRAGRARRRPARAVRAATAATARHVTGGFDRLLHLGNVVVDVVLDVPALPERGGDVLASRQRLTPGGGFNVHGGRGAAGLPRRLRRRATAPGRSPTLARAALADAGIEVLQPPKPGIDTGFVVSVVERRRRADVRDQPRRRGQR